jgi:two-component system response regulator FlrC
MPEQIAEMILIVDDDPSICDLINNILRIKSYEALIADNGQEAINILTQNHNIAAVITDVRMPKMCGEILLENVRRLFPDIPVIIITGYGTIDDAVELMKQGAYYYLPKPFSADKLLDVVDKSISDNRNKRMLSMDIITADPQMLSIIELVDTTAKKSRNTIFLIQGETGTGKELIAKRIHNINNPFNGSFVAVNCAALPESLLESELFGHERGAFTGAVSRKMGKFEFAHRGTILLDEITEVPLSMQAKLLRVLQEGEIDRIGGFSPIKVDVRVIATTNRDIKNEVANGRFRVDLFYRLYVIPIVIPPLRNRKVDIELLANHFLDKFSQSMGTTISKEAMEALKSYNWPGNVRELENAIRRAVLLCRGNTLSIKDFFIEDDPYRLSSIPQSLEGSTLRDIEKHIILNTLEKVGGDRFRAAEILGITTRTIYNKLQKYMVE